MSASEHLKQLLKDLEASSVGDAAQSINVETRSPAQIQDAPEMEHNVPVVPAGQGYLPELYNAERDIGIRRESGANQLKRLRPKHKRVLALHLAGWPSHQIANELGYSIAWVSTVLSDPLSKQVISSFEGLQEEEFKRLRVLANDALRDALQPGKPDSTRLNAARIFHQKERDLDLSKQAETAEDVMAKVLQNISDSNVQINFNLNKGS